MKKIILISIPVIIIAVIVGLFVVKNNKKPETISSPTPEKTFTLEEISNHKDATSCWMAIGGKVYDVTSFIPNHPGGDQILLGCGKDATEMFNNRPTDGTSHSSRARDMLQKFEIGNLAK
ncbi:MAG TPA: cytochrome b5-like heme/steroid binding domain-containing protein [Alphaproteobacteria bacterium]|jgi:cytochrome b involved in lipid metabolism|nr:cytochrome b5-like heme/steroid binding domain-containing protein [Alphaproteobacteria bacterium]